MRNGGKKDIYAQKVSGSGSLSGSNYCICNAANEQEAPSVAYNSADNQYLVTWQDGRTGSNGDIYAQMISGASHLQGNEIAVRVGSGTSLNPSVTYNSNSNVYFVAWEEDDDIFAQEITNDGALSGSGVVICDVVANQGEPSVAYNSANNLYFIAWQDYRNGNFDIYGAWAVPQRTNQPPINPMLASDKPEPQTTGTSITWTASATDLEGDTLYYRFWIKGPSTGNSWAMKRDWSTDNTWTWDTNSADIGDTDVSVRIRDGHHEPPDNYDIEKIVYDYQIVSRLVGAISVSSTPSGATIWLKTFDGPFVGPAVTTPYVFTNVPVGTSTITLSLEGYPEWSGTVTVSVDETTYVQVILDRLAPP
ncbi:MAG: PEGA domain-containing protein [Methanophagales archaeon]|nr:PEGA domain-containing protein [Methanophagales archaeon]